MGSSSGGGSVSFLAFEVDAPSLFVSCSLLAGALCIIRPLTMGLCTPWFAGGATGGSITLMAGDGYTTCLVVPLSLLGSELNIIGPVAAGPYASWFVRGATLFALALLKGPLLVGRTLCGHFEGFVMSNGNMLCHTVVAPILT